MNKLEQSHVIRQVLKQSSIEDSSDFTVVSHALLEKIEPTMAKRIEPIVEIETSNVCAKDWAANAVYSQSILFGSNTNELRYAMNAYRTVMDFLLLNDTVGKVFRMDETDHIGWRIYKELDAKYVWCKNMLTVNEYREAHT